jgi:hypothetical protein
MQRPGRLSVTHTRRATLADILNYQRTFQTQLNFGSGIELCGFHSANAEMLHCEERNWTYNGVSKERSAFVFKNRVDPSRLIKHGMHVKIYSSGGAGVKDGKD